MARATWSGTISFGMVSVPIKMYTALKSSERISFNQLNPETGNRVRNKKVDEETGDPVEEVIKGYQIERDKYVIVDEEELAALTPDKSSTIELLTFVNSDEIDPMYINTPYHLGPNTGGDRSYAVLEKALRNKDSVAIGKVVMRSKEYLCIVRPAPEGGLMLSTLHWQDEMRDHEHASNEEPSEQEVAMAEKLIEMMTNSDVEFTELKDTYTEELKELIEKKAAGKVITPRAQEREEDLPDDIFAALEASIKSHVEKEEAV